MKSFERGLRRLDIISLKKLFYRKQQIITLFFVTMFNPIYPDKKFSRIELLEQGTLF